MGQIKSGQIRSDQVEVEFEMEVEGGFRKYFLKDGKQHERMIHVSSLIRLHGLLFSPGKGGPAARVDRRATIQYFYLSRDVDNSIQACCYE